MRLFIAAFPPKEVLDIFRDLSREYSKQKMNLKFIPIDQLHITLKFIGPSVSERSKNIIIDDFERLRGNLGKFDVNIKNIQYGFKKEKFPKYLLANVERSDDISFVADRLHQEIKNLRLDDTVRWKEKFVNDFHITLARLKATATNSTAQQIKTQTKNLNIQEIPNFTVENIFFVESYYIRGKGPYYRKLHSIKL